MRSQNRKVKKVGRSSIVGGEGGITREGLRRFPEVMGKIGSLGLLTLGVALVNPVSGGEQVSALTAEELEAGSLTSSVSIGFAPTSGNTTLSPSTAAGASGLISVLANVGVTNSGGYSVYLGSNSPNLVGRRDSSVVIPGVSGAVSYDNLQDNTWGYYAGVGSSIPETATYKAVATGQGDVLYTNNNSRIQSERQTFVLGFAAKIDNTLPADTYSNQVTLSVVSSPYQVTLLDIDNLQDMTTAICENTSGLATKQLKDVRDGKYYWVTKLADSNCWMTQNLDLDLSTSVALTPATSDVASNWTPAYTTATVADSSNMLTEATGQRSWNLGDYRIAGSAISSNCGELKNDLSQCPEQFTSYTTPTVANGDELAHYIAGNYYQWNTATAGTGGMITGGEASGSICPKGWRLPTSNSAESGSLAGLLEAYSIVDGDDASMTLMVSGPLYFVKGGYITQATDRLFAHAGLSGNYWSSTPSSNNTYAYGLAFWRVGENNIGPSSSRPRNYGFSVRCLAR